MMKSQESQEEVTKGLEDKIDIIRDEIKYGSDPTTREIMKERELYEDDDID